MLNPLLVRLPDGGIRMERIAYGFAMVLAEVPGLIGRDQPPAVRERLYPAPSDDEQLRVEWERLMVPELFALLASARDIVRKDLQPLVTRLLNADEPFEDGELLVPAEHVNAWISALNAARLALGTIHEVGPEDLVEGRDVALFDDREAAIARIDYFAWFQGALLHGMYPPPADADEDGDADDTDGNEDEAGAEPAV